MTLRAIVMSMLFVVVFAGAANAQTNSCTQVASGTNQNITAFSTCRNVANAAAVSVCAVTNADSTQWSNFYTNPPAGVTISSCATACSTAGGFLYNGYCYYKGASGATCNTACSSYGGCNVTGTVAIGSGAPSNAPCEAVQNGLSLGSGAVSKNGAAYGYGCAYISGTRRRYTGSTTNCTSNSVSNQRACACNTGGGCVIPGGSVIDHGTCVTTYSMSSADNCSGACATCASYATERCCSNGVLSGGGNHLTCSDTCGGGVCS